MTTHAKTPDSSPTTSSLLINTVTAAFSVSEPYQEYAALNLHELIVKNPPATFFMRVEGNSMQDANIQAGDIVVVDRSIPLVNGKIVIAVVAHELVIKRLLQQKNRWLLQSSNTTSPDIVITEELDAVVWGVITYVIHAMR